MTLKCDVGVTVKLRDEILVISFSSLIKTVAGRTAESQRESEVALDQYVFSYFRGSYREMWFLSGRRKGGGRGGYEGVYDCRQ